MKSYLLAVASAVILVSAAQAQSITVEVVNDSGLPDNQVFVLLSGQPVSGSPVASIPVANSSGWL